MAAIELNSTSLISDANLRAYYRFNNGAITTDSSGNGYTLSATSVDGSASGKFGYGAEFTAQTDQLKILSDFGIAGTHDQTFNGWLYITTDISTNGYNMLYAQNTTSTPRYFQFYYRDISGTKTLKIDASGTILTVSQTLTPNTWYMLTAVRDNTNSKTQIYVNGSQVGSDGTLGTLDIYGNNLSYIFGDGNESLNPIGIMDDAAVFDRALSASEISNLYESTVIYSDPADARIYATDATWATARGATTGTLQAASTNPTGVGSTNEYLIRRFFMFFDSVVDGTVSEATFSFQVSADYLSEELTFHIIESSQANPIVADDFNNVVLTSFGSVTFSTAGVKTITLNAAGIAYINTNLGSTIKLCLTDGFDVNNSTPTSSGSWCTFYTGDETTQQKPKLTLTYSTGINTQINISDTFKSASAIKINVGDSWRAVTHAWVNIADTWRSIF